MILLLVENPEARKQHQHAHGHADQILGDSGESAVNDQLAHEVDIVEHRVKLHQPERKIRQDIHRVENRGEIRPGQNEHAIEMRDIAEIHRQRGEHRAQTDRKQERIKNRNRHQQQRRMERRARDDHHDKHRDERKAEVHQRGKHAGNREQVFGQIDLFNQRTVGQNGVHRVGGRFGIKRKNQRTAQVINREIRDILLENRGKHHRDDAHHQQRIEHRPEHAQHRLAVTHLDIARNQFNQQRIVFFQGGRHVADPRFQILKHLFSLLLCLNMTKRFSKRILFFPKSVVHLDKLLCC